MPHGQPVALGIHDGWLAVRTGPLMLAWKLDSELRFPRVDESIRSGDSDLTTLEVDEQDARFLRESLKNLPHDEVSIPELTLDLNGSVAMRIKPGNCPRPIEFVLNRSQRRGSEVRFLTDPRYLDKALELGFRRFHLNDPKGSVVGRDGHRYYVWMALDPRGAIDQSIEVDRIESASITDPPTPKTKTMKEGHKTMSSPEQALAPTVVKKQRRKRLGVKNEEIGT
jgi:hypothetical protein